MSVTTQSWDRKLAPVTRRVGLTTAAMIFIGVLLVLIAAFRPIGFDRDSLGYVTLMNLPFEGLKSFVRLEPTFWLITGIQKVLFAGYTRVFFVIYAVLGVSINLVAIRRLSSYPIFSIIIYFFLFFLPHEYTEIRAGVASAIFLLAVSDITSKRRARYFLKSGAAILFHYSAIITPFIYFLKPQKLNKAFYFLLPFAGMAVLALSPIAVKLLEDSIRIFPDFLYAKLNIYLNLVTLHRVHVFNLYYSFLLILYLFAVLVHERLRSRFDITLIKVFGWALFLFYSLSFNAALAFRLSGLLLVVLIILVPDIAAVFKPKVVVFPLTFIIFGVYFVYTSATILNW